MAGLGSKEREVGDKVMEAGLGQRSSPCWHCGDIECYTEGGGISGAEMGTEVGHALKCFSRITLAAVLKTGAWLDEG